MYNFSIYMYLFKVNLNKNILKKKKTRKKKEEDWEFEEGLLAFSWLDNTMQRAKKMLLLGVNFHC